MRFELAGDKVKVYPDSREEADGFIYHGLGLFTLSGFAMAMRQPAINETVLAPREPVPEPSATLSLRRLGRASLRLGEELERQKRHDLHGDPGEPELGTTPQTPVLEALREDIDTFLAATASVDYPYKVSL